MIFKCQYQNQTKIIGEKTMLPQKLMGKNYINSANSSSTTEVTLTIVSPFVMGNRCGDVTSHIKCGN